MYRILRIASKKNLFTDNSHLSRFGALSEGLRTQTRSQLAYQFVMSVRRMSLAVLVVSDNLTAQMLCYRLMMVFLLIYVGLTRASFSHRYDLMHELFLMV